MRTRAFKKFRKKKGRKRLAYVFGSLLLSGSLLSCATGSSNVKKDDGRYSESVEERSDDRSLSEMSYEIYLNTLELKQSADEIARDTQEMARLQREIAEHDRNIKRLDREIAEHDRRERKAREEARRAREKAREICNKMKSILDEAVVRCQNGDERYCGARFKKAVEKYESVGCGKYVASR